jgi:oligosaccharyltransferase complex subunit alpha (ribophorin I)
VAFFRINLPQSLAAGQEITVDVEAWFTHILQPYPHSITQSEKQFIKFAGNRYFYSPYKTASLTTEVQCTSSSIESYTKPASTSDNVITYGPFENVQKFSQVCFIETQVYIDTVIPGILFNSGRAYCPL